MEVSRVKIHYKMPKFVGFERRLKVDEKFFHKLDIKLSPIKCSECFGRGKTSFLRMIKIVGYLWDKKSFYI